MKIRIGDLRTVVREAMEQLPLPGIDTGEDTFGPQPSEEDLEKVLKMTQQRYRRVRRMRDKGSRGMAPQEWTALVAAEKKLGAELNRTQAAIKKARYRRAMRKPGERERWARYGGDPRERPRGLGT